MTAADSNARISPADRDLMRRLTGIIVFLILFTAAFSYLWRLYATKFYDITGDAAWIWVPHRLSRNVPVVFFAAHDFDLPEHRAWTRIKILGDPEYQLYFNGTLIGGRRVGDDRQLDVFDVSELARDKGNRILVAVRSTNGVGGLIAAVDLKPEIENYIVTGPGWKLFRTWHSALPVRDRGASSPPMVIGEPPTGRWNFLTTRPGDRVEPPVRIVQPVASESYRTGIPTIEIRSGVAVAGQRPVRATAYDFGPTTGRIRLTATSAMPIATAIEARTANTPEELRLVERPTLPFVFAPGELTVTDPEERSFRYVIVYGGRARAEVVQ
ncbi:MAG TPA: hypothetical protein VFT12_11550 [Thermoanaerobaculia bacterium]|nr:hypothetical protein [Thermoanaerobaculia bacterium]